MADKGIVERLRRVDGVKMSEPDQPSVVILTAEEATKTAGHIEALEAEIARLTEGAIEGWAIPIEHEHPLLKEWLVSSHPATGLGEREQRPCKLIIDTQGDDE